MITFQSPIAKDDKIQISGYCYHSLNVISFSLALSDHIKRVLLYKELTLQMYLRPKQTVTEID